MQSGTPYASVFPQQNGRSDGPGGGACDGGGASEGWTSIQALLPGAASIPINGTSTATSGPVASATSYPPSATSYLVNFHIKEDDADESSSEESAVEGADDGQAMTYSLSAARASIINNIAGKALTSSHRIRKTQDIERRLREAGGIHTDATHDNYHARRVAKLRIFIRRLFSPLGLELQHDDWSMNPADLATKPVQWSALAHYQAKLAAKKVLEFKAVRFFFMLLVWYAMFGPDLAAMQGITAQHNNTLALINTAVLFSFTLEIVLNCLAVEGYTLSGRFWVDVVATCSIIGDTAMGKEIINSDAVAGARVVRLLRMSRTARLPRMFTVFRKVQILRLIPQLMERFDTGRRDLALLLMKSRLQHVLLHLDEDASGFISASNAAYFHLAFSMEFGDGVGAHESQDGAKASSWMSSLKHVETGKFGRSASQASMGSAPTATGRANSTRAGSKQSGVAKSHGASRGPSWAEATRELMSRPAGQTALQHCMSDIQKLQDGTKAIGDLISRATLRVCMIVLFMLVVLSVLRSGDVDWSDLQGLALMHNAVGDYFGSSGASGLNLTTVCDLARAYADRCSGSLRVLVLHKRIFWDVDGRPCDLEDPSSVLESEVETISDLRETLHEEILVAPVEASNYALWCWPADVNGAKYGECGKQSESFAMFDNRDGVREEALQSIYITMTAVAVLVFFVVFFSYHTKGIFDSVVLHPLWKFLDDMCAARCLEVIAEEPVPDGLPMSALVPRGWTTRCANLSCWADIMPAASEELVKLDTSFRHLRGAMRSWAKYVPSELFNAIVDAGIESALGVVRSEVTILFVDVANIDALAHEMPPSQMLVLLGSVLQIIVTVVEDLEGTVLEFIGDEVLAIFNAPALVAQHTLKALMAAVEMQDVMRKRLRPRPKLSIGVHCDEVFVGNLGSSTRMKYGVIGDGVNMTARLKSLNTRFQTGIITTAPDLQRGASGITVSTGMNQTASGTAPVGDYFVTRPIGNLVLKGRKQASEVYEVLCKRSRKAQPDVVHGAELHTKAFGHYLNRSFEEASSMAKQAHDLLSERMTESPAGDLVTQHLQDMCTRYIESPPGPEWDGSEKLQKKAW